MPKVSIITVCYNAPDLEKTCDSIVNQVWQDFEWIVIDGGSNEETQKIWDRYKYRIDKFVSEPDGGIYNAMNKGITLANGEYLNFLNAGDYYNDPNVLNYIANNALKEDIEYADLKVINPDGAETMYIPPDILDNYLFIIDYLPHQSTFIKKELFLKYGLYSEEYKIVSDIEKNIVFIKVNNCSYKHINIPCSVYNTNGISYTNNKLREKENYAVVSKYFTKKEISTAYNQQKHSEIKYSLGEQIFSIKNYSKVHKILTILGIHIKIYWGV